MKRLLLLFVCIAGCSLSTQCEGLVSEIIRTPLVKAISKAASCPSVPQANQSENLNKWETYTLNIADQVVQTALPEEPAVMDQEDCTVLLALSDNSFYMIVIAEATEEDLIAVANPNEFLADMRAHLDRNVEIMDESIRTENGVTTVNVILKALDEDCFVKIRMLITNTHLVILTTVDLEIAPSLETTVFLDGFKLL